MDGSCSDTEAGGSLSDRSLEGYGRKGASAKPEQEQFVALHVVVKDESVQLANVPFESVTKRAAGILIQPASGADALLVDNDLVNSVRVARQDCTGDFRDVGRSASLYPPRHLIPDIPSSISADDNSLH